LTGDWQTDATGLSSMTEDGMQADTFRSRTLAGSDSRIRSERRIAAAVAALLGLFLLWGVGFSHIPALHNAAHDTRHSLAFPCH
jgi:cobalt transporter subunit CbtB